MIDLKRENMARIVTIDEVIDHPNADRLDIIRIKEWQCVAQKGIHATGNKVIYFEIDSILPNEVERKIFGPDSKVKLSKSRVKTIKLRGAISQGLVVPVDLFFDKTPRNTDVTQKLGIGKYVPTPKKDSILYTGKARSAGNGNENFTKMRKPTHSKNAGAFYGEEVIITEKIHGTSFVAGWFKRESKTILQKLKIKLFGKYQFCYRSMNNQLQAADTFKNNIMIKLGRRNPEHGMLDTLYGRICVQYNLMSLKKGVAVCGEIYGSGVQGGYAYGCAEGVQKLAVFGIRVEGKELPPYEAMGWADYCKLPFVPVLFEGISTEEIVQKHSVGKSILDPKTKIREGCVTNTVSGESGWAGLPLVKTINPKYLLKEQTEFN